MQTMRFASTSNSGSDWPLSRNATRQRDAGPVAPHEVGQIVGECADGLAAGGRSLAVESGLALHEVRLDVGRHLVKLGVGVTHRFPK